MSWIRKGDEWNSAPEWMKAFELAAARGDDRLVNELKGGAEALYVYSAQQWTDYVVGYGAAANLIGLTRVKDVINDLMTVGVVFDESTADEARFRLLERENFVHIIRSDEKKKKAKRKRDLNRGSLQVPVLLRDGDQCRYCGVEVKWGDTRSDTGRHMDHRAIDEETTPDNYVVSCRECNGLRSDLGVEADAELPLMDPPEDPIYGPELITKISRWNRIVEKEAQRLGIPNPLTRGKVEAQTPTRQPAGGTDPTAPTTRSPEPDGSQSSGDPRIPQASRKDAGRGRAAKEMRPAASREQHPFRPSPSPEPDADQAPSDPRSEHEANARAPHSANETAEPVRQRRRRRRR